MTGCTPLQSLMVLPRRFTSQLVLGVLLQRLPLSQDVNAQVQPSTTMAKHTVSKQSVGNKTERLLSVTPYS